jgi:hypothetical protein
LDKVRLQFCELVLEQPASRRIEHIKHMPKHAGWSGRTMGEVQALRKVWCRQDMAFNLIVFEALGLLTFVEGED